MNRPCLLWRKATNSRGYPVIWARGRTMYAHRLMYENKIGPIPKGFSVGRLPGCPPICIRPEHLVLVEQTEQRRAAGKARWA